MNQYKTLKKYSGQKYNTVHKKQKDPYMVRNNMNMILITNQHCPLFVSREEIPTNARNNQFFVYEFKALQGELKANIHNDLKIRMGHYIRTTLKDVYANIDDINKYRYSIEVPITKDEREMFQGSISALDFSIDSFLLDIVSEYERDNKYLQKGGLPKDFGESIDNRISNLPQIIKQLYIREYIHYPAERIQVDGGRKSCYKFKVKMIEYLKKHLTKNNKLIIFNKNQLELKNGRMAVKPVDI
jgi:hypothetical protein